jgi:carboxymethylenebutenolidase
MYLSPAGRPERARSSDLTMCFAHDARPPALPADFTPIAGGAAAETLELTSADGTRFSAALAESPQGRDPAVVILPDVRGLYQFYVELAERFAEAGRHAIAIDYFGRTAGLAPRDESFEYMPHVEQTRSEQVQADTAAAIAALRDRTGASAFVTVGFCFGGTQSFNAAMSPELGLAGAVGFYGRLSSGRGETPPVLDRVGEIRAPALGLFGGADPAIPAEDVEAFDRALDAAGVTHEVVSYPGAPHSFFDRRQAEHAGASEDAWRRVLGFLDRLS